MKISSALGLRRSVTWAALTLVLAASAGGCGLITPNSVRVGVSAEPLGLEVAYSDEASAFIGGLIHAGLFRPDATLAPQPLLAAAPATASASGGTWTVQLRSGLTFHDGSALTGADVVFTYELAKASRCPLTAEICDLVRSRLASVTSSALNEVTFTLQAPWAPWATRGLTIPILPKAALEASLVRLQAQIAHADRNAVTLTRENLAAELESGTCTTSASGGCDYASHLTELERTLSAAGLTLPDARLFPQRDSAGAPTGARDDEAYARDLYARLGELEDLLLAPTDGQLAAGYPLLDLQTAPIGAGPFAFKQRVVGESMQLTAFPAFAGGAPKVSSVAVTEMGSASALIAAFQDARLDWIPNLRAADVSGLKPRGDAALLHTPSLRGYYFLAFNLRPGHLFADLPPRDALASCIDLDGLIADATDGTGIKISSTVVPGSWGAETSAPAESSRDVSAARAILANAGWVADSDGVYAKGGHRLEVNLLVRDGQMTRLRAAQVIADQALACGISITVSPASYTTDILPRLHYPSDFDLYLGGWQWGLDPDDSDIFSSAACPSQDAPSGKNFVCWQSSSADTLLADGLRETSLSARADTYIQFQQLRRAERPYLLLWGEPAYALLSTRFYWATRASDLQTPFYAWSIEQWSTKQP